MYKKFITPLYIFNIVLQSFFNLLTPPLILGFIAWLLNTRAEVGEWIYVVLIMIGVFTGLYSMIAFILNAMRALERLEKEREDKERKSRGKDV